jgi:hypothetical protein
MHSFSPGNRETPHPRNCSFTVASISERLVGSGINAYQGFEKNHDRSARYRTVLRCHEAPLTQGGHAR